MEKYTMKIFLGLILFCATLHLLFGVAGKPNDVFLSCSSEDVRKSFVDHLHKALTRAGISTFTEDDGILIGENIRVKIKKALRESKLAVVVFSNEYPKSTRCLDELAMIMERRRVYGYTVVTVYYNVEVSDVRDQTGTYGEAFAVHEKQFDGMMDKVETWGKVLKEAADVRGWSLNNGYESRFIERIVKDIGSKVQGAVPVAMADAEPSCSCITFLLTVMLIALVVFLCNSDNLSGMKILRGRLRRGGT